MPRLLLMTVSLECMAGQWLHTASTRDNKRCFCLFQLQGLLLDEVRNINVRGKGRVLPDAMHRIAFCHWLRCFLYICCITMLPFVWRIKKNQNDIVEHGEAWGLPAEHGV